jgi:cbb3-type cytochrome oxidase maturation protein
LAKGAGRLAVHVVALVVGLILMAVGLAMGVSIVLLPIGIPVGLAGLLAFLWGIYGRSGDKDVPTQPPGSL